MKLKTFFFNIMVFRYHHKHNIHNVFYNPIDQNVGFLDKKGDLYKIKNGENIKKIGSVNWNYRYITNYKESGKEWLLTSPNQYWFSRTRNFQNIPNSISIYNDYSNIEHFLVTTNGNVWRNGNLLSLCTNRQDFWTSSFIYNDQYIMYITDQNDFAIHHIGKNFQMFKDNYKIPMICNKIIISEENHFIHIFLHYPNFGVRVLKFYSGFHNYTTSFFISVFDSKDISSYHPYLSVFTDFGKVSVYRIHRNEPYELKYSKYFPELIKESFDIKQYNRTIFLHNEDTIFKFLLVK